MAQAVENIYAEAVYELGVETNSLDDIYEEISALKTVFEENGELTELLSSPSLGEGEKQGILKNIFEGRVSDITFNFLCVLSDKGRVSYFSKIADVLHKLYNDDKGIMEAEVITSQPLSEALEEKLVKKLCDKSGKKVVINKKVDKSIIGGIIVRFDDRELDSSLKKRLEDLRRSIDSTIA
ncbi:MAG: F0F1 ATP synthase subunit delta [Ruminococcus sp.]|nr:F0F1 ATP synthase subunit delta [Ruminococcus sp.]